MQASESVEANQTKINKNTSNQSTCTKRASPRSPLARPPTLTPRSNRLMTSSM